MAATLPPLDLEECLDYQVDFSDLMPVNTSLIDAQVELESITPDESPLIDPQYGSPSVFLSNTEAQASPTPSPLMNDTVVFWLDGANMTDRSKYIFKVSAWDDAVPKQRCYVRRVSVKGKLK